MTEKKNKSGLAIAAIGILILLAGVILLENISSLIPNCPAVLLPTSQLFTVLKKGAVYSLVAVSMNLLNGFTGLFSLGQAGFMLLGAYTYAILMLPVANRDTVYYLYGGAAIKFSLPDLFGGGIFGLILGAILTFIAAGCVAAFVAWLIGLPVLRLKSDYLAIATLGFAEILRAIFQWDKLGPVTNGANMIANIPNYSSFNVTDASGKTILRLSTFIPFLVAIICITIIVMLINSSYGRAFKAIREDEIAAEAMYVGNAQAKVYTSAMTYEILLIVVIGGIGSITGSCIATFLYVACSEWWLRFLDSEMVLSNGFKVPLLRNGFRMVVFSIVIMIVVLFFRKGIMGNRELPDLFKRKPKGGKAQ